MDSSTQCKEAEPTNSSNNNDFVVDDCFVDDDLLTPDDLNSDVHSLKNASAVDMTKSFLERDNFESELGTTQQDDPFGEDFGDISSGEIIDVFADGDLAGRPVVVFYAYRLPSNKSFDHYKFLRFIQFTLDKIVDCDYTIIYFHYGLRSNNKPSLKWLIQAYQLLDRRYKKNLKALYLVHPTRKCIILNLPEPIIRYDRSMRSKTPNSALDDSATAAQSQPPRPTQQFNVSLKFILDHHPNSDLPPIVLELITFLCTYGLKMEGIFRRSAPVANIKTLQHRINMGESIDFINDPMFNSDVQSGVIHAAALLKTFLRSLGEPLITNKLYPELALLNGVERTNRLVEIRILVQKLPLENYLLLQKIVEFLAKVAEHSQQNLMDANNLSVVFGPNLTWPTDQQVPMVQLNNLNSFCYSLIKNFDEIFVDNY
uniref:Rho-GAP domain-containing protein n=1 Tax=Globodera rostochiensis TaxID=31243 RepID=A0A914I5Q7_GLORO